MLLLLNLQGWKSAPNQTRVSSRGGAGFHLGNVVTEVFILVFWIRLKMAPSIVGFETIDGRGRAFLSSLSLTANYRRNDVVSADSLQSAEVVLLVIDHA